MGNTKSSFVVRKLSVKENVYSRSLITELSALEKKKMETLHGPSHHCWKFALMVES